MTAKYPNSGSKRSFCAMRFRSALLTTQARWSSTLSKRNRFSVVKAKTENLNFEIRFFLKTGSKTRPTAASPLEPGLLSPKLWGGADVTPDAERCAFTPLARRTKHDPYVASRIPCPLLQFRIGVWISPSRPLHSKSGPSTW